MLSTCSIDWDLPFDYQWRIINDTSQYKLTCCARQVGKTFTGATCLVMGNERYPGALFKKGSYLWVCPSYKQVIESALPMLKRLLPESIAKYNAKDAAFDLCNGSRIIIRSAQTGEDSIRGLTVLGAVIDEAAFINQEIYTRGVLAALSVYNGFCYLFTTPDGYNWVYDITQDKKEDKDWSFFSMKAWDSPLHDYDKIMAYRGNMPDAHWRAEFLGEFVSSGGALFNPEWFSDIMVSSLPQDGWYRSIITIDLSLGKVHSDYQAVVFAGLVNGFVYMDVMLLRMSVTELLDVVKEMYDKYKPEGLLFETNAFQVLAAEEFNRRFPSVPIWQQTNTESKVETRIQRLSLPLSQHIIKIKDTHMGRLALNQLRVFPDKNAHDDFCDAAEMALRFFNETLPT